jgi:hypothetical protein
MKKIQEVLKNLEKMKVFEFLENLKLMKFENF